MATNEIREFEIDGHRYVVRLHDADDGLPLALALASMGIPAMVDAASAALPSLLGEDGTLGRVLAGGVASGADEPFSLEEMAGELVAALATNGAGIKGSLSALLADERLPALARSALAHTTRDGEPCIAGGRLSNAYRGRYMELGQAVWLALRLNAGFGEPGTSQAAA